MSYTTDPAHEALFTRPRRNHGPQRRAVRLQPTQGLISVTKQERVNGCLPGMGPLYADVKHASAEFAGNGVGSSVELSSEAYAANETRARQLLDQARIRYAQGGHVSLWNAPHRPKAYCTTEFFVKCPAERAVVARGKYSAIRLLDFSGGVDVETTRGRITLLNVGNAVNARVVDGIVDYAGQAECEVVRRLGSKSSFHRRAV